MQAKDNNKPAQEHPDLDDRYGDIGISALVAALRYCSGVRNPSYAPAPPKEDSEDVAA
jgi:hypothetical protein